MAKRMRQSNKKRRLVVDYIVAHPRGRPNTQIKFKPKRKRKGPAPDRSLF